MVLVRAIRVYILLRCPAYVGLFIAELVLGEFMQICRMY
jgi:hypothetical protein